jgi:hypothetical protein
MTLRRTLTLEFQPGLDDAQGHKELRDGLSTVLQVGRSLWLANDESASVERLTLTGGGASSHRQFALRELLDLPVPGEKGDTPEIDIEGMAAADGYLWVVGSHSLKRCKPGEDDSVEKAIKRLARTDVDANRFLLARIPLQEEDGLPVLVRKDKPRRAQQLRGDAKGNELTRLLRKDKHVGPFIGLPGKENGFDIEGLAVVGERLFLGLRGPVLRGWAVVLELRPVAEGDRLELASIEGNKGPRVRKHFLQLRGLGVRDLCLDGDDLLVLAGPTMSLDGPVRVLRWRGAATCAQACVLEADALEHVLDVPSGEGCDHAEGLALFRAGGEDTASLLVVYDSPAPARQVGASSLLADVFDPAAAAPSDSARP